LLYAVEDGIDGRSEADDCSCFSQHLAIARVDERTATRAEYKSWLLGELGTELRLEHTEGWLAIFGKDAGDGLAKVRFNLAIHVYKGATQFFGKLAAHSGLARTHKAGDDNVLLGRKGGGNHSVALFMCALKRVIEGS
jgi:hypothetical protein